MNREGSYNTANGGDDTLNGGDGADKLYGDAYTMNAGASSAAHGGDDVLNGGAGDDELYGDAYSMNTGGPDETAYGGDDVLNGGSGDDFLWGDAHDLNTGFPSPTKVAIGGHDTFVFEEGSGHDIIYDFGFGNDQPGGRDQIDLSAFMADMFPALAHIPFDVLPSKALAALAAHWTDVGWDLLQQDGVMTDTGKNIVIDLGLAFQDEPGVDTIELVHVANISDLIVDDFIFV